MSGNWDNPDVPKLGWECIEVYDSLDTDDYDAELHFTCQMCENKLIRYVHVMAHAKWSDELHCGCVCAGHMEGDGDRASRREALAKRRRKFPSHKNWREGQGGCLYIRIEHHVLIVMPDRDGWKVSVIRPDAHRINGSKRYDNYYQAQFGAFDALVWSKAH